MIRVRGCTARAKPPGPPELSLQVSCPDSSNPRRLTSSLPTDPSANSPRQRNRLIAIPTCHQMTVLRRASLVRRDTLPASKIGLIAGIVGGVTVVCLTLAVLVWKLLYLPNRHEFDEVSIERASTDSLSSEHRGYAGMLHRLRRASSPGIERTLAEHTLKEKEKKSTGPSLPPGAMAPAMPGIPEQQPATPPMTPPGRPRMPRRLTSPTPPTLGTPIAPISEASSAPSTPVAPITPLAPTAPDSAPMTPIMRPTSPEPPETPPRFPNKIRHADDSEDLSIELLPPLYREEWAERRSLHLEEAASEVVRIDSILVTSALTLAADAGPPLKSQVA